MKATEHRSIEWLYAQIPDLVREGIIDEETGSRLRSRYGEPPRVERGRAAMAVFAVLGSVLVGLGAILVFAFNWMELPRTARAVLACAPLAASIGLGAFVLARKKTAAAWRESAAALISLSLAGAFALVGQTYQLPGGLDDLLLPWFLLSLPLAYVFDSGVVQFFYLLGISAWACLRQIDSGQAAAFWPFLALVIPRIALQLKKDRRSAASAASLWSLSACLTVCLGVCLEKVMPGLWIILYGSFFSCLYLADKLWMGGAERAIERPLGTVGGLGVVAMAFILSYGWPWREIGWEYLRSGPRFNTGFAWIDYLVVGLAFALSIAFLCLSLFKKKKGDPAFAFFPVAIGLCYAVNSIWGSGRGSLLATHLFMNAFILYAGLTMIVSGIRLRRVGDVNGGAMVLSLLIALRFIFAEDFFDHLAARGLAFIALGAGFLAMNVVLAKTLKGKGR